MTCIHTPMYIHDCIKHAMSDTTFNSRNYTKLRYLLPPPPKKKDKKKKPQYQTKPNVLIFRCRWLLKTEKFPKISSREDCEQSLYFNYWTAYNDQITLKFRTTLQLVCVLTSMVSIVCMGGASRCDGGIPGIYDRHVDRGQLQVPPLG